MQRTRAPHPRQEWTLSEGRVHYALMIDLEPLIPSDAVECPDCQQPSAAMRPVYVRQPGPGASFALNGLACPNCWPAEIGLPLCVRIG